MKKKDLMIEILQEHKGVKNPITEKELNALLGIKGGAHMYLRKLMFLESLPIGFKNSKGYFWITDETEAESVIADLQSRINALQKYINHLRGLEYEQRKEDGKNETN